jgi:phosphoribosyl 1,2-cyclic phosphodiesterase
MLTLTVLGSGSSGNCAVLSNGRTTLLLDAGLSARQIVSRMSAAGLDINRVDGILLTHEHQDHTGGLRVLLKNHDIPLICTALTREIISKDTPFSAPPRWVVMQTGCKFEFQDMQIECFPVQHDAVDPVGFALSDGEARLGFLSDVGSITHLIRDRLQGADALFVEANYDTRLLDADTKRPWAIKQRISGRHGHLSNDQTADLVASVTHPGLRHVVLGHLSDDCNQPELAERFVREAMAGSAAAEAAVFCASRRAVSPAVMIGEPDPW